MKNNGKSNAKKGKTPRRIWKRERAELAERLKIERDARREAEALAAAEAEKEAEREIVAGFVAEREAAARASAANDSNVDSDERVFERVDWVLFEEQYHPVISTSDFFDETRRRDEYVRAQLELNETRCGTILIEPEKARHILEGSPIYQAVWNRDRRRELTTTVRGWSGGHANPGAAKYGKSQIPDFWTGERFLFEVSDILGDNKTRWIRQEVAPDDDPNDPPRFVCVEERYGVPIRVVAERSDDEQMKCVTAFPDYRVLSGEGKGALLIKRD